MKKYFWLATLTIILGVLLVNFLLNIRSIPPKKVLKRELINYMVKEEEKNLIKNEKWFVNMEILGTKRVKNNAYVYAWVYGSSYYLEEGKIIEDQGFSIPYRYTINYQNGEVKVLKEETPGDGEDYVKDIKKLFPWTVRIRLNSNYNLEAKNRKEAEEYFKNKL